MTSRGYHHGELRAALVSTALELITEHGLGGFSVAEIARRAGVSPAAPYRHFPDRASLLAAVAAETAERLDERLRLAAEAHTDPAERLAAAAGAYTEYYIRNGAGLHVVFAGELRGTDHPELHARSRAVIDRFLELAFALCPQPTDALALMEQIVTQAHGYAAFYLDGVFAAYGYDPELVAEKSVAAARTVARAHAG